MVRRAGVAGARARPWRIVFDGGSLGNPGRAYGSFRIAPAETGSAPATGRREFGLGTNNEAEYWTLIAALQETLRLVESRRLSPEQLDLEVRGDSRLVLEQLRGKWRARDPRMRDLRDLARAMLDRFRSARLVHQPRARSVRALGH
ncbi:MAG: ribonuclease HI family protein [Anaerolineales bacterium]